MAAALGPSREHSRPDRREEGTLRRLRPRPARGPLADHRGYPRGAVLHPQGSRNEASLVTDGEFRGYWRGQLAPQGRGADAARALGEQKRFFHWFLEFPEIMDRGGFDCILGNPPYLGGQALSGTYGHGFCECMKWRYAPTGLSELVVYFLRRIHELLRDGGFTALITTNSIVDGDVRKDGLEQIVAADAQINMAIRGMKWPGTANLVVSLLAVHKGRGMAQECSTTSQLH